MRVMVMSGRQSNQLALVSKIAERVEVAAVVFSRNVPRERPRVAVRSRLLMNRILNRVGAIELVRAWHNMQRRYDALYPTTPIDDVTEVGNVNDLAAIEVVERVAPDLLVVSGTNLVGRDLMNAAARHGGIVNLHTGISPYVRGGPNCTNWCLAERSFHLIGNTVMWLDAGIDTGNIIATEQTRLSGAESLSELHWQVMEHAHAMYVEAIGRLADGQTLRSIPQRDVGEGRHFRSLDWGYSAARRALRNFRQHYSRYFADPEKRQHDAASLRLFPIAHD